MYCFEISAGIFVFRNMLLKFYLYLLQSYTHFTHSQTSHISYTHTHTALSTLLQLKAASCRDCCARNFYYILRVLLIYNDF